MVLFHRTPLDQRRNSGLLMSAEDIGLGAFASPLVGYLGKVNERAASLEYCPWCTSKGLTHTLRSYRVNLKESITLCTNSDCLFPLVSRSLDDILASLVPVESPVESPVERKRKLCSLQDDDPVKSKCLKFTDPENLVISNVAESVVNQEEPDTAKTDHNGHFYANGTEGGKLNEFENNATSPQTSGDKLLQDQNAFENVAGSDVLGPSALLAGTQCSSSNEVLFSADDDVTPQSATLHALQKLETDSMQVESPDELHDHASQSGSLICSKDVRSPLLEDQQEAEITEEPTIDISTCEVLDVELETDDLSTSSAQPEDLVSLGPLFWKNGDNLCWLDALLVFFVNCNTLRKRKEDDGQQSFVWKLKREYASICAAVGAQQLTENDGSVKVPRHVLQKANVDLRILRMSIFKMLQPELQCELGQRETPVFALPLLLKMDSNIEPLFQATLSWEFKCSGCKLHTRDQVTNTLPTLTNLVPDWHPLHATHSAPCNRCSLSNQRRTLVLERVPPVFALHFVEGLPQSDVNVYNFNFSGKHYSITSVIQYKQDLQHFITWVCQSEGSWLEFDDLKNKCQSHDKLPIPAREMHVVFWEEDDSKNPCACSPTSTSAPSPTSTAVEAHRPADGTETADESCCLDQSLLRSHSNFDIADVLSTGNVDTTDADKSIGSTTLLDTFEGLSQNDIITLTLDFIPDSNENDPSKGVLDKTPVPAEVSGCEVSQGGEAPTSSHTSETEPAITTLRSGPATRNRSGRGKGRGRGRGRGRNTTSRTVSKQEVESTATVEEPDVSTHLSPQPSEVTSVETEVTTQVSSPAEAQQPPSPPVSPTQSTAPPVSQPSHIEGQRWSFLISRHPAKKGPVQSSPICAPIASTKPLSHSTPIRLKSLQTVTPVLLKPKLRTEESDSLPVRASERYSGFSVKSIASPSPPDDKTQLHSTLLPPSTTKIPKTSSKIYDSQWTVPKGMSETEALRYKLLKKLKAKKRKLAKLNEMLSQSGAGHQPDSTNLPSPHTVSSSTYEGSYCDNVLSELMSPATTISNLSPDSSGFLDMYVTGQDAVAGASTGSAQPQLNSIVNVPQAENFLEEFLCQAAAEQPSVMESNVLSELDLFF